MRFIRRIFFSCGILILLSSNSHAVIQVMDGSSMSANLMTWATEASRWGITLEQYAKQAADTAKQIDTMIGDRLAVVEQFISTAQSIYAKIKRFGMLISELEDIVKGNTNITLNADAQKAKDNLQIYDTCAKLEGNQKAKEACDFVFNSKFAQSDQILQVMNEIVELSDDLSELSNKIKNSQDIKESQDLANTVAALQQAIQSKKTILESYLETQENERQKRLDTLKQYVIEVQTKAIDLGSFGKKDDEDND
ncbi:MAG: type IV secretion system protein [Campylobacteraceae bacterium]|jgi:type IV secretion system protein VirB5|nr:type IV secretion system protein [Campylobacteraceae bacterium]